MNNLSFLFSDYREKALKLLLLNPNTPYHVREIARISHTPAGSLHRELAMLAKFGILLRNTRGNQVTYQANIHFYIFEELSNILKKTTNIPNLIQNALLPLANQIECAFIFGSTAKGTATQHSDIDLFIITNVEYVKIIAALYDTQVHLHREINPKVVTLPEWEKLLESKSSFIKELLVQPKIFILGSENGIKKFNRNKS